ncbi:hypothetical protein Q0A17_04365 [Citrobacter sp. S2-9]|uniref:Ead/Ea22-like family protein n=1 Tax=Citrobacter enshiensis TaxID=2971264 RepID=A0ABT8PSC8_9ENTR|nr:hypothetical protein [Citrobacter enshiensis]MDN8598656.1 hypothetical protein [Citrobacter enshiensis]
MTTKQNAIDLAKTARSEAAAIANGTKRTITQIITNWNECVGQAGFMCIYDFPTTGYSRKSQIADDLIRCAAQLDDYCEPNPHAPQTVEQQTREINAALTRVLDSDEAHAEALEFNNAYNTLYVYEPGDAARNVWPQLTPVERTVSVELAHKMALREDQQHDDAIAYFARKGAHLCTEAFSEHQIKQMAEFCHAEALELNQRCSELYYRYWRWWNVMDEDSRADDLALAHKKALEINSSLEEFA